MLDVVIEEDGRPARSVTVDRFPCRIGKARDSEVALAGWRSSAADVTSLGAALDAVEQQPAGPGILIVGALGFVAFGAFSFIEARFRRIRPPRDLNPLD